MSVMPSRTPCKRARDNGNDLSILSQSAMCPWYTIGTVPLADRKAARWTELWQVRRGSWSLATQCDRSRCARNTLLPSCMHNVHYHSMHNGCTCQNLNWSASLTGNGCGCSLLSKRSQGPLCSPGKHYNWVQITDVSCKLVEFWQPWWIQGELPRRWQAD